MKRPADIEASRKEYLALPENEWRKDYFDETTGGFVATHVLKAKDAITKALKSEYGMRKRDGSPAKPCVKSYEKRSIFAGKIVNHGYTHITQQVAASGGSFRLFHHHVSVRPRGRG